LNRYHFCIFVDILSIKETIKQLLCHPNIWKLFLSQPISEGLLITGPLAPLLYHWQILLYLQTQWFIQDRAYKLYRPGKSELIFIFRIHKLKSSRSHNAVRDHLCFQQRECIWCLIQHKASRDVKLGYGEQRKERE
jgi:hypothetical protein